MRKAFLDSELAGAWHYAATHEPDLEHAMTLYFPLWSTIVEANQPIKPERCVDHADLAHIPQEFFVGSREIPLPEFGRFYPGADQEFLESLRNDDKPQAENPEALATINQ